MKPPFKQTGPALSETGRSVLGGVLVIVVALISAFASIDPSAAPDRIQTTEIPR